MKAGTTVNTFRPFSISLAVTCLFFPVLTAARAQDFQLIKQSFKSGSGETAWELFVRQVNGLTVQNARFMRGPDDWVTVLSDARLSRVLVPYYNGDHYWDLYSNSELNTLSQKDAGETGVLLDLQGKPKVVREIRDVGPVWRKYGDKSVMRRGKALVVWGAVSTGHYCYIIQYSFFDDGSIAMRVGSTGHLQRGTIKHMHTALWRIDVDLGSKKNSVAIMEHEELAGNVGKAKSVHTKFAGGKEGFADWDATRFTMLQITNKDMNLSYDLMAMRGGSARHFGKGEDCTQHDFWVSKRRPKYDDDLNYQNVPEYVDDNESVENEDVVIWCSTSMQHEPRTQDKDITYAMWSGVDLRPRDLFTKAPHYPKP